MEDPTRTGPGLEPKHPAPLSTAAVAQVSPPVPAPQPHPMTKADFQAQIWSDAEQLARQLVDKLKQLEHPDSAWAQRMFAHVVEWLAKRGIK